MHGQVVVVAVDAIRPKGNHHLRLKLADDAHQFPHGLPLVDNRQLAVQIVEENRRVDAIHFTGAAQLLFAHGGQAGGGSEIRQRDLPCLAAGGRHHIDVVAFGGILRQRAAGAKGFVVGVSENGHQVRLLISGIPS